MVRSPQDLKAALKELGLPVTGKKDDLVQRLLAAKSTDGAAAEPAAAGDDAVAAEAAAAAEATPAAVTDVEAAPEGEAAEAEAAAPAAASKPSKHAPIVFNTSAAAATASVSSRVRQGSPGHITQCSWSSCMCVSACMRADKGAGRAASSS